MINSEYRILKRNASGAAVAENALEFHAKRASYPIVRD